MKQQKKQIVFALLIVVALILSILIIVQNKNVAQHDKKIQNPISCTIEIRCNSILENMDLLANPGLKKYIPEDGIILQETEVTVEAGSTVYDVLVKVTKDYNIQMEAQKTPGFDTYYIQGMNHLYEKNVGQFSGWLFYVNEEMPEYGCSKQIVEDNDKILWEYTCSY